jgi:antitoxin component of RelBE/YafQ-DinJ toxin-antitoxin module
MRYKGERIMVKNDIIHIRINNDIKEELRAIAGEKGLTLSSLVGLIISEYLSDSKEVKELVE